MAPPITTASSPHVASPHPTTLTIGDSITSNSRFINAITHRFPWATFPDILDKFLDLLPSLPTSIIRIVIHVGTNDTQMIPGVWTHQRQFRPPFWHFIDVFTAVYWLSQAMDMPAETCSFCHQLCAFCLIHPDYNHGGSGCVQGLQARRCSQSVVVWCCVTLLGFLTSSS